MHACPIMGQTVVWVTKGCPQEEVLSLVLRNQAIMSSGSQSTLLCRGFSNRSLGKM